MSNDDSDARPARGERKSAETALARGEPPEERVPAKLGIPKHALGPASSS